MKLSIVFLTTTICFSSFAQSQTIIDNAPKNYLNALKSDNNGAIESAIFYSVKLTLFFPEQNTDKLIKEIERLVNKGETEVIRYKAYLAHQFMTNAELMSNLEQNDYKDAEEFFGLMGQELNEYLLAVK